MSAEIESLREPGRARPSAIVSGYLSAFAIFFSLLAVAWHPLRLSLVSILLALVATAMADRKRTLTLAAVIIAALGFFLGLTVAVVTSHPLW